MEDKTSAADFYNSIHEIWEELEVTLQEIRGKEEETNNVITFLRNYVRLLHEYSNEKESKRYLSNIYGKCVTGDVKGKCKDCDLNNGKSCLLEYYPCVYEAMEFVRKKVCDHE